MHLCEVKERMCDFDIGRRNLPDLFRFSDGKTVTDELEWQVRRREIKEIICGHEYGRFPPEPLLTEYETLERDERFCAGKVTLTKVLLESKLPQGDFSFPVYCAVPKSDSPLPAFVHINFRADVPDKYMPTEEICDNGFAVFSFCYTDVTSDDGDFSSGLAGVLFQSGEREPDSAGKIALWSWAAMRVMDYLQTLESIDLRNVAVIGHSRLGKTSLLTGAFDDRFAFTFSNDSGCGGAAISRNKTGETIEKICGNFPYWFCENFRQYAGNEENMPFDQHFLSSLIAPRGAYIASAEQDLWADPVSEFLGCVAAGRVYSLYGKTGFVSSGKLPEPGETLHDGSIGYHLRKGTHYLGRYDWQKYMEYIKKHMNQ